MSEPTPSDLPRLLTIRQVVGLTRRSRSSLFEDISLGRLKATKLGRSLRIAEADYLAYLERGRREASRGGKA